MVKKYIYNNYNDYIIYIPFSFSITINSKYYTLIKKIKNILTYNNNNIKKKNKNNKNKKVF